MPQSSVSMAHGQPIFGSSSANADATDAPLSQWICTQPHPSEGHRRVRPSGMKFFSRKAFEHLLFELHASVYHDIDRELQRLEEQHPGAVAELCTVFDHVFRQPTTEAVAIPQSALSHGIPMFDLYVFIDESQLSKVRKCDQAIVKIGGQPPELGKHLRSGSNHLVLALKTDKTQQTFTVPLPLVLQAFESRVCKPGTFQVYEHTLARKKASAVTSFNDFISDAARYVGITSRTWQIRSREHSTAAERGSHLLFHRALRSELFDVKVHEHIVLRAGLNRSDALHIEEVEVEQRTLHDLHPHGLNMIPGGEAGLRFLASMTKRKSAEIKIDDIDALLEIEVLSSLRPSKLGIKGFHSNQRLAKLWETDIQYRIKAMTNQGNRLSYRQIRCARIWHASGWSIDKILENLTGLDGRAVTLEQLQRLLDGKSYESIPHVLIPIGSDSQLDA